MARTVRAGLIGCGSLSLIGILPQLAEADARERIELVAVADVVEERARQTAARFDVPHHYGDARRLIERDDIELVLVITPIAYHFPYAMAALEAGKHVYVQKTMTESYREATELVAAARERQLTLVSAPGQMLAPAMQAMKRLVDDGGLEAITSLAHALDLVTIPLLRAEDTPAQQDSTVMSYAQSKPLVWIASEFGEAATRWAHQRGPMTLLVETGAALSEDERRRVERFVVILGRQDE